MTQRISGFLLLGIGHVIAEEVKLIEAPIESWEVRYPAVCSPGLDQHGRYTYSLDTLVPEYLFKPNDIGRSVRIPKHQVMFKQRVNERMAELYLGWRNGIIQKWTGITMSTADPKVLQAIKKGVIR